MSYAPGSGLGLLFSIPFIFTLGALFTPAAWLGSIIAALYAAPRLGITGRMSLIETVILAVVCATIINKNYPLVFPSAFNWALIVCALFAALTLRYLAGKLKLRTSAAT